MLVGRQGLTAKEFLVPLCFLKCRVPFGFYKGTIRVWGLGFRVLGGIYRKSPKSPIPTRNIHRWSINPESFPTEDARTPETPNQP